MQCFMSKKIALPKSVSLRAIAWNKSHGYIACGGSNGVLKVLKMESRKETGNNMSASASSSLSTNQSLDGHAGAVSLLQWNESYQKLTSCDKNGFIMVWMEHKGIWYEEMVNNRQKSLVKGMAWNHDGQKICIAYDDGVIIVGSVDGNRIWGKELKGLNLTCVEWSPDGRLLLLGSNNGEVHIYEFGGAFVGLVSMPCLTETKTGSDLFVISWFKNQKDINTPSLVIAFESGTIQLMKNENDTAPVIVDTGFTITTMEWSPDGSILAIAGKIAKPILPDKSHEVKFYSPYGQILYKLRFAGNIAGLSWESGSQRIALAVDSYIFFASIRPYYKWCYFSNTLAYAYCKAMDKKESTIMFWNTNTKEKHIKLVKNLLSMAALGDFCCLATKVDETSDQFSLVVCNAIGSPVDTCNITFEPKVLAMNFTDVYSASTNRFCKFRFCSPKSKTLLQLTSDASDSSEERCSEFNFPHIGEYGAKDVDRVSIRPICCIAVSDSVLVLADTAGRFFLYTLPQVNLYHVFQNTQPGIPSKIAINSLSNMMACINIYGEITFHHILDFWTFFKTHHDGSRPNIEVVGNLLEGSKSSLSALSGDMKMNMGGNIHHSKKISTFSSENDSDDPTDLNIKKLSSIYSPTSNSNSSDVKEKRANQSPAFIPALIPEDVLLSNDELGHGHKPMLYVNEGSSNISLSGYKNDYFENSEIGSFACKQKPLDFDRKCAWDIKWASDDGLMCAIMDKMRMYIYRGTEPEEPMTSFGYMCEFRDLEVKSIHLMDLLQNADDPNEECFIQNEVKSLRDTRSLIENVGIKDASQFIEENSHPRLWRLLAEAAMRRMDFGTAESAFVRCKDYQGIQFVKSTLEIQNETTKKAEVAAYFKNLEEADKIYLDNDQVMSAIHLHRLLGDWFKVFELLKSNELEVKEMEEAWNGVGDFFFDRQRWSEASTFYEKAHNEDRFAECCYMLEDYSKLEKLLKDLPEGHKLLPELGSMFVSVGMCEQAVSAYIKCNKINLAIDCCTTLNQWKMAISLAQKYDIKDVNSLLLQYAGNLKQERSIFTVIELYKKACKFLDAALILYKCVKDIPPKLNDPFFLRKVYILIAILVTEYKSNRKASNFNEINLYDLGTAHDEERSLQKIAPKLITDPWRGAKAYHFLLLSQKHLYQGYMDAAMRTALHLREYEDILNFEDIYSLLALSSCANRAFATCSAAFMKLESLETLSTDEKLKYKNLAAEIFIKHPPRDSRNNNVHCKSCAETIPDWYTTCPSCCMSFPICIASGKPIMNPVQKWTCLQCHHSAFKQEMLTRSSCALCHFPSVPV